MVNYSNSKIYKICSFQTDLIYIGSTTQSLSQRLAKHKDDYKNNKGTTSKEILQYSDAQIILLESVNCENKDQLHAIERRYIENNNCCNKVIPSRTQKEYLQTTQYKEKRKKYIEINKEKIKTHQKIYERINKDRRSDQQKNYYEKNKEQIKEYYEINKEHIRERQKKEYQQNREQILKNQKQYKKFTRSEIGIFIRSFNFKCPCEV